jgi:hypothetical protein
MDDNRFDDIIKNKIGEYESPEFDPTALAGFHYRMASQYSAPWYVRYRSEMLVVAASITIALLMLWGQWKISNYNNGILHNEIVDLQNQNKELAAMQDKINSFKPLRDTVRIVEFRNSNEQLYYSMMAQLQDLKRQVAKNANGSQLGLASNKQLLFLGREEEIPFDVLLSLKNKYDVLRDGDYLFIVMDEEIMAKAEPYLKRRKGVEFNYVRPEYEFVIDSTIHIEDNFITRVKSKPVQISVKQLRDLEKHYKKGIGIEVGPAVEVYRAFHKPGTSSNGIGGGVIANFITSPTLSFETGVLFNTLFYDINVGDLSLETLPEPESGLGELEKAEFTSWLIAIPINLKYRYRLNQKSHFMLGAGVSPMVYTKQTIDYYYSFDTGTDDFVKVESSNSIDGPNGFLGTANLSLGISKLLRNNKRFETSLFYKRTLDKIGAEQVKADFFGLRGAYMFTLK